MWVLCWYDEVLDSMGIEHKHPLDAQKIEPSDLLYALITIYCFP